MPAEKQYPGQCLLCNEIVSRRQATVHLKKCVAKQSADGGKKARLYHLVVEGKYLPMYWLHLEISGARTLAVLDSFLRDIWLECCGHLSCFAIEGQRYSVQPMRDNMFGLGFGGAPEKSMNQKIYNLLSKGTKLEHEYDFGSTTHLDLRVVGVREGRPGTGGITLLARNQPPPWQCRECGKPATRVEACGWGIEPDLLLCDECGGDDDEMLLPVVNSPRTGVCGYVG